jgi:hypothetical protein
MYGNESNLAHDAVRDIYEQISDAFGICRFMCPLLTLLLSVCLHKVCPHMYGVFKQTYDVYSHRSGFKAVAPPPSTPVRSLVAPSPFDSLAFGAVLALMSGALLMMVGEGAVAASFLRGAVVGAAGAA